MYPDEKHGPLFWVFVPFLLVARIYERYHIRKALRQRRQS